MMVGWMRWGSATVSKIVAMVLPTGSDRAVLDADLCVTELTRRRATVASFEAKTDESGFGPAASGQKWRWLRASKACPLAQVDLVAVEVGDAGAVDLFGDEDDEFFAELHQVVVVGVGLVELEHGELGVVLVLMPSLRKLRLIS